MIRFVLCCFFFMSLSSGVISQDNPPTASITDVNNNFLNKNIVVRIPPKKKSTIEGSTLLFRENVDGYVVVKNNDRSQDLKLNYDLLTNMAMIYLRNDAFQVSSSNIDSIIVRENGIKKKYLCVKVKKEGDFRIMEILVEGKYTLLKYIKTQLMRPNYNPVLERGSRNYTVKKNDKFYMMKKGRATELPNKAKKVAKSGSFNMVFKDLVKEHNPKMKKEKDLVKFFQKINESSS